MFNLFIKSVQASISVNFALAVAVAYPAIYFMILIFGSGYIYSGFVQERTKNLADYIAVSDGWEVIKNNTDSIEYMIDRYNILTGIMPVQPIYKNTLGTFSIAINFRVYAIYIKNNAYNICAKITYPVANSTGTFPVANPSLDSAMLGVDGPAWIVQGAYTFRRIKLTHTVVRRVTGLTMNLSNNAVPYSCTPTTTAVIYP